VKTKAVKTPTTPEMKETKTSSKNNIESQYFFPRVLHALFAVTLLTSQTTTLTHTCPEHIKIAERKYPDIDFKN
jgi:hypothetical protein